jgi:cell division protein FtsI/penicillin-binding protein 2
VLSRTLRPVGHYVYTRADTPVDSPGPKPAGSIVPGVLVRRLGVSAESMAVVRGGMHDVVQADSGTGKRARVSGLEMGGKTGSAEYGPRAESGMRKKYAWMIAFAPFERPRYAIALVIEDGVSGGVTAAPRVGYVMAKIFGVQSAMVMLRDEGESFDAGD